MFLPPLFNKKPQAAILLCCTIFSACFSTSDLSGAGAPSQSPEGGYQPWTSIAQPGWMLGPGREEDQHHQPSQKNFPLLRKMGEGCQKGTAGSQPLGFTQSLNTGATPRRAQSSPLVHWYFPGWRCHHHTWQHPALT